MEWQRLYCSLHIPQVATLLIIQLVYSHPINMALRIKDLFNVVLRLVVRFYRLNIKANNDRRSQIHLTTTSFLVLQSKTWETKRFANNDEVKQAVFKRIVDKKFMWKLKTNFTIWKVFKNTWRLWKLDKCMFFIVPERYFSCKCILPLEAGGVT